MAFYNPMLVETRGITNIVYLDQGVEAVLPRFRRNVVDHLLQLHSMNGRDETDYKIAFLWKKDESLMTDLWRFFKTGEWDSGPLSHVRVFNGLSELTESERVQMGTGSGNTRTVVAKEDELLNIYGPKRENLIRYLTGPRPTLPDYLSSGENFCLE